MKPATLLSVILLIGLLSVVILQASLAEANGSSGKLMRNCDVWDRQFKLFCRHCCLAKELVMSEELIKSENRCVCIESVGDSNVDS